MWHIFFCVIKINQPRSSDQKLHCWINCLVNLNTRGQYLAWSKYDRHMHYSQMWCSHWINFKQVWSVELFHTQELCPGVSESQFHLRDYWPHREINWLSQEEALLGAVDIIRLVLFFTVSVLGFLQLVYKSGTARNCCSL